MSRREEILVARAKNRYRRILPTGGRKNFAECFTSVNGRLCFWFDTPDHSTHVVLEEILTLQNGR